MKFPIAKTLLMATLLTSTLVVSAAQPATHDSGPKNYNEWTVAQLEAAMAMIANEDCGVLVYLRQEGRGIGLVNKIKAYALQDNGQDTVQANESLGFKPDLRDYGVGAQILSDLGLHSMRIITNNPRKIVGLEGYGLHVTGRVTLPPACNSHNLSYLLTKKEKLGHWMEGLER